MPLDPPLNPTIWQELAQDALGLAPKIGIGLILFVVFWILAVVVDRVLVRMIGTRLDRDLTLMFGRIGKITLLIVGAMVALGTMGVDVTSLVAGLGLTGFALGFALKDIISNALAGILIIIYEPFHRGDTITVTGLEGAVEEVNLRYTVLDMEGKRAFIPNANLFTNAVVVRKRG